MKKMKVGRQELPLGVQAAVVCGGVDPAMRTGVAPN